MMCGIWNSVWKGIWNGMWKGIWKTVSGNNFLYKWIIKEELILEAN